MKNILILLLVVSQSLHSQTTFYKQYGQGQVQSGIGASCVQQTFDGGYIMTGFIYPASSDAQVYLVKTNTIGDTLWTKMFGGVFGFYTGAFVKQTSDSGYVITGMYMASEIYLIKTNTIGDTLWTKHYGNAAIGVGGNSVQQTTDGGYIIAGTIASNSQDVYLVKTDINGDTLWTKTYGGSNSDIGNSVQQTTDGGYIIAGETWSNTAGSSDAYLVKTNASGDTLWTKKYGGTSGEDAKEVRQTSDGGYVFCGGGNGNIYVVKTDANGTLVWQKSFGGISHDAAFSIKQTTNGYIVAGQIDHFSSTLGGYVADACLLKINVNGIQQWNRNFGPLLGNPSSSYANFVSLTSDGGYVLTGTNQLDYLIKTDSLGLITTTGISSESEFSTNSAVLIYPNPSDNTFNFVIPFSMENTSLEIYNSLGALVFTQSNLNQKTIELTNQPNGLYFVKVMSNDKVIGMQKIVKQ